MIKGNAIVFEVSKKSIRAGYMIGGGTFYKPIQTRPFNPASVRSEMDVALPAADMVSEILADSQPLEIIGAIGGSVIRMAGVNNVRLEQALRTQLHTELPVIIADPIFCGVAAEWHFGHAQFDRNFLWVNLIPKLALGALKDEQLADVAIRTCGLQDLEVIPANILAQELALHIRALSPEKVVVRDDDRYDLDFLPSLRGRIAQSGFSADLIVPSLPDEPYLLGAGAIALSQG